MSQYNGKWPTSLVYVSKPLITVIATIVSLLCACVHDQLPYRVPQLFIVLVASSSVAKETAFWKFNSLCRRQGIFHRHKVKVGWWGTVVMIPPPPPFPGSKYGLVCQWSLFVSDCVLDWLRTSRVEEGIESTESNTIERFSKDCWK